MRAQRRTMIMGGPGCKLRDARQRPVRRFKFMCSGLSMLSRYIVMAVSGDSPEAERYAMDFSLPKSVAAAVEAAEEVGQAHCSPGQEQARAGSSDFPSDLYRAMGDAGLLQLWGRGPGGDYLLEAACVSEALARYSATAASLYFVNGVCGAMRLAGGRGFLQSDVFNRIWRDGALGFYAGGTLEIQREEIARALKF